MKGELRILIPTDFSAESEIAIHALKMLQQKVTVKTRMLYVMSINSVSLHGAEGTFMDAGAIQPTYLKELRDQAQRQIARQARDHGLETVAQDIIVDNISSGIADYAAEKNMDLIIMGTKQAKGLMAWLNGSDAQVVARLSSVPLLTISKGSEFKQITKILFLHDCKKHPLVAPHPILKKLQKIYNAEIHLYYANSRDDKEVLEKYVQDYLKAHKLEHVKTHTSGEDDIKKIVAEFQNEQYDMLCMGTHGRSQISQIFKKSITEYMIAHSSIPVLSYRID